MRLWISGSRGFLGRHVAQEALRRGHELFRLDVDLTEDEQWVDLVPPLDAIVHCAGVTRWSPKPRSDKRFVRNIDLARAVAYRRPLRLVFPLPHGALKPWNAYSQSMCAAIESIRREPNCAASLVPVYLPTLYGLGDPHHAKAIPSFLLAATGRGEQPIVVYPPKGAGTYRHYMHVEMAARILVDCAVGQEFDEVITGPDRWVVRYLANLVHDIAAKYGRNLIIEERGWQYKLDGTGSPVPACIGPDGGPMTGPLPAWLDKVIGEALEKLIAESAPRRVASTDAPPTPTASPAAPLHDDRLPNQRSE